MTPFDELATVGMGLAVPGVGCAAGAVALRRALRRWHLPPAADELAERLELPLSPLESGEMSALLRSGAFGPETRASHAVRWDAPDATFRALLVAGVNGPEGVIVVTPHNRTAPKRRLVEILSRSPRNLARQALPGNLAVQSPGLSAVRMDDRLVVRRPDVRTADELELLLMAACAILDA